MSPTKLLELEVVAPGVVAADEEEGLPAIQHEASRGAYTGVQQLQ